MQLKTPPGGPGGVISLEPGLAPPLKLGKIRLDPDVAAAQRYRLRQKRIEHGMDSVPQWADPSMDPLGAYPTTPLSPKVQEKSFA